jgi:hypothetical protein
LGKLFPHLGARVYDKFHLGAYVAKVTNMLFKLDVVDFPAINSREAV